MSEIKLLPCPFCGGEAIVYEDEQYNQYMIGCKNCCAVEPMTEWTSKENAIAQWNTRKSMQEIVERLEEEKTKKYKDWNKTSYLQDFGGYRECKHIIEIVKEVGGMSD